MANTPTKNMALSLTDSPGRQLLESQLNDYIAFLRRQPAFCGTPEQHETLVKHVAQGNELIKLVTAERLKITRQLDQQKHDWMTIEKELTDPIVQAMEPLKNAVDHYNRELLRIQEHQQAEPALAEPADGTEPATTWLNPQIEAVRLPKNVRLDWRFDVIDPNQLPNGYWKIDEAAIRAAIADGVREIPGLRIYAEPVTTFRK
ncbi:hypothetical protein [Spirosoma rhododendri]|uniref:Uncharacterized protein n=1 Tax=Spirosoma rhododendri TaxID=2728024 RepID=A0A7L5DPH5_9BACT|nr:hypothetical protein [Spirosoma rhododendri]QJD80005.1 hypothetical protein HH216_17500 [Spirosoma rhododendri]